MLLACSVSVLCLTGCGREQHIGGLAGNDARESGVSLDFISGNRTMTSREDGINVGIRARDCSFRTKAVNTGDKITVKMYNGGGYAAVIE